ncbi:MAG: hypothetical protein AAFY17_11540 [Cyanobacteria bacterium J06642_11]
MHAVRSLNWGWVSLAIALSACGINQAVTSPAISTEEVVALESTAPLITEADVVDGTAPAASSCAPMESRVPLQPARDIELPFERFNFRSTSVTETEDTLTFTGSHYSFTLCQRDRSWGVAAIDPVPQTEADYAQYYDTLGDPEYDTIKANGQSYEARVRLDAPWIKDPGSVSDVEQVFFELIKPGETEPTGTLLYTNADILERELGASAGIPSITRSLATEDALWWAIGFEQGEGASGVSTIVQYELASGQINSWQPDSLGSAQITDLAITGSQEDPTLWLGTQYSGEGNPYLPADGLVAYHPISNRVQTYTVENSPLIGAIPTRLWAVDQQLWVATGSGVCEVDWADIEANESWNCWRFTALADVPEGQDLYASLQGEAPIGQWNASEPVEILWLADQNISSPESILRYEINYPPGITTQLSQGADYYVAENAPEDEGYFWWPGHDWSWNGKRFVRPWDQVSMNYVGGGPSGMGAEGGRYVADWKTMRGDFDLLEISADSAEIKYYAAWMNAANIEAWITVTKVANVSSDQVNPTDAILAELKQKAR